MLGHWQVQCWKKSEIGLFPDFSCINGSLARYIKLWVAHGPGMPGTFSPPLPISNPDMHYSTCVTHVSWCMLGSLTSGFLCSQWRGKYSLHSWCMRNLQFHASGKRPMVPYHIYDYHDIIQNGQQDLEKSSWSLSLKPIIVVQHQMTLLNSCIRLTFFRPHPVPTAILDDHISWGWIKDWTLGVPFHWHGLTCISNYFYNNMWDEITYTFPNFNSANGLIMDR